MAKDLVFSIGSIFDDTGDEGVLKIHGASAYYVPPYQRGYKWLSSAEGDAVNMLLKDLLEASAGNSEYYLQFITVKSANHNGKQVLELIDGQQRITTLTLLLTVLNSLNPEIPNLSNRKLIYGVRPIVTEFFEQTVFSDISVLQGVKWDGYKDDNPDYDEQDIFFLYHAIERIYVVMKEKNESFLLSFYKFLTEQVKIIVTYVSKYVDSEKIFSNLNDNKVELTSAELIKGLLLTKGPQGGKYDGWKTYRLISEERENMGRKWDELNQWCDRPSCRVMLANKNGNYPLNELLLIVALQNGYNGKPEVNIGHDLYNFFQSRIKEGQSAQFYFDQVIETYSILRDWFEDVDIYNALGFLLYCRPIASFALREVRSRLREDTISLKETLRRMVATRLPDKLEDLEYRYNYNEIWNTLLALNTFGIRRIFDFSSFAENKWSLEHVFPQRPKDVKNPLNEADISLFNTLLQNASVNLDEVQLDGYTSEQKMQVHRDLVAKLAQTSCNLEDLEKELLYRLIKTTKLNTIGNLTFLDQKTNSSNGNGSFDSKRINIVNLISKGRFVPQHTYDVFSKLLSANMDKNLRAWTERDVDEHLKWIQGKIVVIKSTLSK